MANSNIFNDSATAVSNGLDKHLHDDSFAQNAKDFFTGTPNLEVNGNKYSAGGIAKDFGEMASTIAKHTPPWVSFGIGGLATALLIGKALPKAGGMLGGLGRAGAMAIGVVIGGHVISELVAGRNPLASFFNKAAKGKDDFEAAKKTAPDDPKKSAADIDEATPEERADFNKNFTEALGDGTSVRAGQLAEIMETARLDGIPASEIQEKYDLAAETLSPALLNGVNSRIESSFKDLAGGLELKEAPAPTPLTEEQIFVQEIVGALNGNADPDTIAVMLGTVALDGMSSDAIQEAYDVAASKFDDNELNELNDQIWVGDVNDLTQEAAYASAMWGHDELSLHEGFTALSDILHRIDPEVPATENPVVHPPASGNNPANTDVADKPLEGPTVP